MKKLLIRIMFPFIALFLIVSFISLLLNRYYIGNMMDERISREANRISKVLSNSEFVFNKIYIDKLKEVIEGNIIIFDEKNRIIVSTLQENALPDLINDINPKHYFTILSGGEQDIIREKLSNNEKTFMVTSSLLKTSLSPKDEKLLVLIFPLTDLIETKSNITGWMFLVGFMGLLMIIVFGYFISRSVTKPINGLVKITGNIAEGNFTSETAIPDIKELELLACSINTMAEKLINYEKKVIKSSKLAAAGKITAAVAHEIRNPLSSIKMMSQVLRDRLKTDQKNSKIIGSILEEVNRLERIVRDLTDLIKPSQFSLEPCNLNDLVNEILPVIEPRFNHLKIYPAVNFTDVLPPVFIDKDRIKQVIWNLLLNGMESMPSGGTLKIYTKLDIEKNISEIIIEDEGCGINETEKNEIFDHFFTTKKEGLGIGLAISKEIMEMHKGSLSVYNLKEKGVRAVAAFNNKYTG